MRGVTRNLRYRIEAGDAQSLDYAIKVVPAATILVERVEYHYPEYTGLLISSVEGSATFGRSRGLRSRSMRGRMV